MPNQSTLDIFQNTKTTEMQQKSTPKTYPNLTSWLGDSHVRHFLLQEREEGLMTREEHCFLRLHGFSRTKDPDIFYSKMLKVYYLTTKEKLSRQYLKFSPTWGIALHGRYLTAKISYHKTGKGYSLKDILEESVEEKYYIKKDIAKQIMEEVPNS